MVVFELHNLHPRSLGYECAILLVTWHVTRLNNMLMYVRPCKLQAELISGPFDVSKQIVGRLCRSEGCRLMHKWGIGQDAS